MKIHKWIMGAVAAAALIFAATPAEAHGWHGHGHYGWHRHGYYHGYGPVFYGGPYYNYGYPYGYYPYPGYYYGPGVSIGFGFRGGRHW